MVSIPQYQSQVGPAPLPQPRIPTATPVADATAQLGRVVQGVAMDEIRKADIAAVNGAVADFERHTTEAMYGQNGLRFQTGERLFAASDVALEGARGRMDAILDGLNPRQRQAAQAAMQRSFDDFAGKASSHVGVQRRVYAQKQYEYRLGTGADRLIRAAPDMPWAADGSLDIGAIEAGFSDLALADAAHAAAYPELLEGLTPAQYGQAAEAARREAVLPQMLDAILATGDDQRAAAFLEQYGGQLDPSDRKRMGAAVDRQTAEATGRRTAESMMAESGIYYGADAERRAAYDGKPYRPAADQEAEDIAAIRAALDGEAEDEAVRHYKTLADERRRAASAAASELFGTAYSAMLEGAPLHQALPNPEDIWRLEPEQRAALYEMRDKGRKAVADDVAWDRFVAGQGAVLSPDYGLQRKALERDLRLDQPTLGPDLFDKALKMQEALRKDHEAVAGPLKAEQDVVESLARQQFPTAFLGGETATKKYGEDRKDRDAFVRELQQAVVAERERLSAVEGRARAALTPKEAEDLLLPIFELRRKREGFSGDVMWRPAMLEGEAVGAAEPYSLADIIGASSALRAAGLPDDEQAIQEYILRRRAMSGFGPSAPSRVERMSVTPWSDE